MDSSRNSEPSLCVYCFTVSQFNLSIFDGFSKIHVLNFSVWSPQEKIKILARWLMQHRLIRDLMSGAKKGGRDMLKFPRKLYQYMYILYIFAHTLTAYVYTHPCIYIYTYTYIHIYIYTHIHIYTFTHIHIHIYKYIYIYIYIFIYTYMQYITLRHIILHCIALHYIALHCTALHYITYIWDVYIYTCSIMQSIYVYIYIYTLMVT